MMTQPRLSTIEMVKATIIKYSGKCSKYQLWKRLPRKMMYQTYSTTLEHLLNNNEIAIRNDRKIEPITRDENELGAIERDAILYNLSHYGYDLILLKRTGKHRILPIEELIIQILIRFPEARFIEAIPILILKNMIDKFELYRLAYDYGLTNKIGFLVEIASRIAKRKGINLAYLDDLLEQLKLKKQEATQYFSMLQDRQFLEKNTPEEMKKWNLMGLFSIEDIQEAAI